jgi:hypothetical protein
MHLGAGRKAARMGGTPSLFLLAAVWLEWYCGKNKSQTRHPTE